MPPIDDTGQTGDTGTPQASEAKTPLSGDEAILAELQSKIEAEEAEGDAPQGEGADGQAEGDDSDDIEDGDRKARVPKWVKEGYLRHKDYTQKTMTAAEERKAAEAERAQVREEAKFHQENVVAVAKLVNLDEQLKAYRAMTPEKWAEIRRTNPQQADYLRDQFTMLKDQRELLVGELQQKQHQALEKQRNESARLEQEGVARIAKRIPSWNDELAGKLNEYATKQGFSMEELASFLPRKNADAYAATLHKAYLFDQLQARTRAKDTPKAESAPTPVPKVGVRRAPASSEPLDSDPPEVWLRKRNKQLGIGAR